MSIIPANPLQRRWIFPLAREIGRPILENVRASELNNLSAILSNTVRVGSDPGKFCPQRASSAEPNCSLSVIVVAACSVGGWGHEHTLPTHLVFMVKVRGRSVVGSGLDVDRSLAVGTGRSVRRAIADREVYNRDKRFFGPTNSGSLTSHRPFLSAAM